MPGSGGRKLLIDSVAHRREVAFLLGASCFHPELGVDEVRRSIEEWGGDKMTEEETDAYRSLTPAAFWSAFTRGWEYAREASGRG